MNRLIILTGPSCVGKTPLFHAFKKFYPELCRHLRKLVLYDSRLPRPKEREGVDFYFRPRKFIEALRKDKNFLVWNARGGLMALDLREMAAKIKKNALFFDGNPFIAQTFLIHASFKKIPKRSIFLSPLSKDEILFFKKEKISLSRTVTDMMRGKLLRRTKKHKGRLLKSDLKNIETRARSAYKELKYAYLFDHVIVNHDGEDSDHWEMPYPVGEARRSLLTLAEILKTGRSSSAEHWPKTLL